MYFLLLPMLRLTRRDLIWLPLLVGMTFGWWHEHSVAIKRERTSQAVQADLAMSVDVLGLRLVEYENRERKSQAAQIELAVAVQQQIELLEQMEQRLDEYESQHVLMRRLLRLAQQTRE